MDFNYMPMQPIQIAPSGVTPGRYGNSKQIPTFNVDQRGRLTFAADVNIEPNLQIIVNDDPRQNKTLNLNIDAVRFQSGEGVDVKMIDSGVLEFSLDKNTINEIIDNSSFNKIFTGIVRGLNGITFVDTTNKVLSNGTLTFNKNNITGGSVRIGDEEDHKASAVSITGFNDYAGLEINAQSDNMYGPRIDLVAYKNSVDNKAPVIQDDTIGQIRFNGYISTPDGDLIRNLTTINSKIVSTASDPTTPPETCIELICTNTGRHTAKIASFNNRGVFSAPVIKPGVYPDEAQRNSAISTPEVGMITFISSIGKFQGNVDGTHNGWVNLN